MRKVFSLEFVDHVDPGSRIECLIIPCLWNGDAAVTFRPADKCAERNIFDRGPGEGGSVGLLEIEAVCVIELIGQLGVGVFGQTVTGVNLGTDFLGRVCRPGKGHIVVGAGEVGWVGDDIGGPACD